MKILLFILSFFIVFFAQNQILKKTFFDYEKTKPEYVYHVNSLGQYNGVFTQYSYDGAIIGESTWTNGIQNGSYKEYYIHGTASKLKKTGSYKNDEKDGHWITYTYVKYGQSYFDIMQSFAFNDKQDDIFKTGVQKKYMEEFFDDGKVKKEIKYYPSGKIAYEKHFVNGKVSGEYTAFTENNNLVIKGVIDNQGKMIGTWIVPREHGGESPSDKNNLTKVVYTQKIKFDEKGYLDTNYFTKSYFLSGKLKDSVRVIRIKYQGGYDGQSIWYLCGANIAFSGPYRAFYESGKLQTEGEYSFVNGICLKVGVWKTYDESGILISENNEDELRKKAEEDRIEKERIEKERIEKERIAFEEKIAKEKRDIRELSLLISQVDSSIINVNSLFSEFKNLVQKRYSTEPVLVQYNVETVGYEKIYVVNKKPKLYYHLNQIQNDFIVKSSTLKSQDAIITQKVKNAKFYDEKLDFNPVLERKKIYLELLVLSQNHTKLNLKMIDLANLKTKKMVKQLDALNSVEEKIKFLENLQISEVK